MAMKKDEGRAFIKPYRVVYVYHNQVDAVGDSASTEDHTFDAVRKAIDELGDLVGKIVNSLNGNHLLITADHGFLFQETPPGETDKNSLATKPAGHPAGEETLSAGPQPARQRQGLSRLHRDHGRCRRRDGVLGAEGGQPLPLRRRLAFRAWRRHAPGDRGAGRPRAPRQGRRQGGQDEDAHRRCQRARQQLQGHHQPAPLPADPDRAGRRAGQAGDAEGRDLRR